MVDVAEVLKATGQSAILTSLEASQQRDRIRKAIAAEEMLLATAQANLRSAQRSLWLMRLGPPWLAANLSGAIGFLLFALPRLLGVYESNLLALMLMIIGYGTFSIFAFWLTGDRHGEDDDTRRSIRESRLLDATKRVNSVSTSLKQLKIRLHEMDRIFNILVHLEQQERERLAASTGPSQGSSRLHANPSSMQPPILLYEQRFSQQSAVTDYTQVKNYTQNSDPKTDKLFVVRLVLLVIAMTLMMAPGPTGWCIGVPMFFLWLVLCIIRIATK